PTTSPPAPSSALASSARSQSTGIETDDPGGIVSAIRRRCSRRVTAGLLPCGRGVCCPGIRLPEAPAGRRDRGTPDEGGCPHSLELRSSFDDLVLPVLETNRLHMPDQVL